MNRLRLFFGLLVVCGLIGVAGFIAYELHTRQVLSVRVAGDLSHTSHSELETVVAEHITASLYRVNVAAIRQAVLALPWVKDVSVRRAWPDSLHLAVIEREPIARWPQGGLVEVTGEVFFPESNKAFAHLPLLEGPPGTTLQLLETYWTLQRSLRSVGWDVTHLVLNRRGSWSAELDHQIVLVLGQAPSGEAVEMFVTAFETVLASRIEELVQADLRYTNGFAVRWRSPVVKIQGEEGQG